MPMKDNSRTFKTNTSERNDAKSIELKLNTSLFYQLNVELFLLSKTFKEKLAEYYGKNFAINYKSSYAFAEEWQGSMHNN